MDYISKQFVFISIWIFSVKGQMKEYCQDETFRAECREDQVILINNAQYGRLSLGRCVSKNLGYLPCSADVTRFLAGKCSGKQRCELEVYDNELRHFEPCASDVSWHLQAAYDCVTVQVADPSNCARGLSASQPSGLLSSHISRTLHVGRSNCPWRIQASEPGKKIQLTAFNFLSKLVTTHNRITGTVQSDVCYQFAKVFDGQNHHTLTLCSEGRNETIVYTSTTDNIQVYFITTGKLDTAFILKYSEIGCGSPPFVRDASILSQPDQKMATIRCNATGETWFLTCIGNQWEGRVGNCTQPRASHVRSWSIFNSTTEFPYGLVLVVAIGVALGVFLGGTALVIVSYRMKRTPRYEMPPELPSQDYLPQGSNRNHSKKTSEIPPPPAPHPQTYGSAGFQPCHPVIYDATVPLRNQRNKEHGLSKHNTNNTDIIKDSSSGGGKVIQSAQADKRHGSHLYDMPEMI